MTQKEFRGYVLSLQYLPWPLRVTVPLREGVCECVAQFCVFNFTSDKKWNITSNLRCPLAI